MELTHISQSLQGDLKLTLPRESQQLVPANATLVLVLRHEETSKPRRNPFRLL